MTASFRKFHHITSTKHQSSWQHWTWTVDNIVCCTKSLV